MAFPKSQKALHFAQSLRSTWQPVKNYSINTFIFWGILSADIRVVQCLLWRNSSVCHLLTFLPDSWRAGDLTLKLCCLSKTKPPLEILRAETWSSFNKKKKLYRGEDSGHSVLPVEFRFNNLTGIFFYFSFPGGAFSSTMASRLVPKVSLQCNAFAGRCPLDVQHYKRVHVT